MHLILSSFQGCFSGIVAWPDHPAGQPERGLHRHLCFRGPEAVTQVRAGTPRHLQTPAAEDSSSAADDLLPHSRHQSHSPGSATTLDNPTYPRSHPFTAFPIPHVGVIKFELWVRVFVLGRNWRDSYLPRILRCRSSRGSRHQPHNPRPRPDHVPPACQVPLE
jgi:hypothetical protein